MIRLQDVSFTYAGHHRPSLDRLDLTVPAGELLLLTGTSGCGKTTLTRLLNGLIPHFHPGETIGTVLVDGARVADRPLHETAVTVGSVFHNPRTQFFTTDTRSELAFGSENLGHAPQRIREDIDRTVELLGLEDLLGRSVFALSGGQKQLLACASAHIAGTPVVVLDEPSANLDERSVERLVDVLRTWKTEGRTVVVAEHRLAYLLPIADRVVILDRGRVAEDLDAVRFRRLDDDALRRRGLRSSRTPRIDELPCGPLGEPGPPWAPAAQMLATGFRHRHARGLPPALDIAQAPLPQGEIVAVTGANGAGKTTFARHLTGLDRRARGTLTVDGRPLRARQRLRRSALVMQEPGHQLFADTVLAELLLGTPPQARGRAEEVLDALGLGELRDEHPLALSGGQQQRVAIAQAVVGGRRLIVLDEPSSGLDRARMADVAGLLRRLRDDGRDVFVITHDVELIAEACTWRLRLQEGRLTPP